MSKWQIRALGKISEMCLGKMLDEKKNKGEFQPYLANINVRWGGFDFSNLNEMRFEESEQERYGLKSGDLVVCEGGEPGRCALWKDQVQGMKIQKALHRVRINSDHSNEFVYYRMLLAGKNGELAKHFIGSTIKHLTGIGLKQVEFEFPHIEEQKQIAAVLSALDAKIDCNNRINAELEAMAKTLYDYWFVQFDFPDANGKPYKSSGGKMVYNATLKREIPAGWKDGNLGNLISLEYGKGLKADIRTGSGYPVIGSNGVVGYHSEYLVTGPGIVVGRKGTVGTITFVYDNFFPIDTTYYAEPKLEIGFFYLKQLLSSLGLKKMNSDSAVPGLNREATLRINVALPPVDSLQDFERRIAAVFGKVNILEKENRQLAQLRDWLLPMLMNGQVTVT